MHSSIDRMNCLTKQAEMHSEVSQEHFLLTVANTGAVDGISPDQVCLVPGERFSRTTVKMPSDISDSFALTVITGE
jgi:hypothetical protein